MTTGVTIKKSVLLRPKNRTKERPHPRPPARLLDSLLSSTILRGRRICIILQRLQLQHTTTITIYYSSTIHILYCNLKKLLFLKIRQFKFNI